jgi:hypothetical protein
MSVVIPACFWSLFAWIILFYSFTFYLYMYLSHWDVLLIDKKQWIFKNSSWPTCLLYGELKPFTFRIITERYVLIALIVPGFFLSCFEYCFFFSLSLIHFNSLLFWKCLTPNSHLFIYSWVLFLPEFSWLWLSSSSMLGFL